MNLKDNIVKLLLVTLIIIISSDLIVRVWFNKNLDLLFDSVIFNNVVTPLFTIISVIIYSVALFLTISQTKIILSQNIKPFYEKEIEKFINKAENIKIESILFEEENVNALNYITYISKTFIKLIRNKEYIEDVTQFKNGCDLDLEYFTARSYIKEVLFLSDFTMGVSPIHFFYQDLKEFIIEIDDSKLIEEDKKLLKKQIKRTFVAEYLALINLRTITLLPEIPLIFGNTNSRKIVYKRLTQTEFNQYSEFFNKNL